MDDILYKNMSLIADKLVLDSDVIALIRKLSAESELEDLFNKVPPLPDYIIYSDVYKKILGFLEDYLKRALFKSLCLESEALTPKGIDVRCDMVKQQLYNIALYRELQKILPGIEITTDTLNATFHFRTIKTSSVFYMTLMEINFGLHVSYKESSGGKHGTTANGTIRLTNTFMSHYLYGYSLFTTNPYGPPVSLSFHMPPDSRILDDLHFDAESIPASEFNKHFLQIFFNRIAEKIYEKLTKV